MRKTSILLAGLLVIAGCSRSGSEKVTSGHLVSSAGLPSGWSRVQSDDGSASVGLPPGWRESDLSHSSLSNGMARVVKKNAQMSSERSAAEKMIADNRFKLLFVARSARGMVYTSNGTVAEFANEPRNLDQLAQENETSIEKSGALNATIAKASLPAGDAYRMDYDRPYSNAKGSTVAHHTAFFLIKDGNFFMLSVGTPEKSDLAEQIAETLVVK